MNIESQNTQVHNADEPNLQPSSPSRFLANVFLLVGIGILVVTGRIVKGTLAQYLFGSFPLKKGDYSTICLMRLRAFLRLSISVANDSLR